MITRKIPFTLIFTLLFFPLSGQVRAADVSTLVMEGAAKGVGGWVAGQAMDSIFPLDPKESPSREELAADITASTVAIESKIDKAVAAIEAKIDETDLDAHLGLLDSLGATPVSTAVGDYDPVHTLNPLTDLNIQTNDEDIQKVISATTSYSTDLSTDIKIGTDHHGYNGFWRSFPTYVSNKVTNLAFRIERWHAKQSQTAYKADGSFAYQIVEKNLQNLEDIYNHLEKHVPTMPISDGVDRERHTPKTIQQNLNCVIRTDPDTQLVTSKGELIRRYAGYDDVADHLPSATNVWRMWGYCRGDKSNLPPAYYGWANTNYEWAAGKHVGPTDDINECRQISTFGRCNSRGIDYGCSMEPNQGHEQDNPSYQGKNPMLVSSPGGFAAGDPGWDNEIPGHDRTVYTKFLWHEAMVLDGSPAHRGQGPNAGQWDKSSLTGQGTFVNYLRTWENTVCAMGPDGKQISQEFPNAPALPHLTNALFDPNSKMPTNNWPKKITDSLPLTVIKTMTPTVGALSYRDADTSAAYYFIKRNHATKTAELSKPYQSELSAAHDRSLHYFTEFKDEGLHTAYCQIASMVSIGNQILPTLEARIKQKELVSTKNTPKPSQITTMLDSYRQVSHKLGITKENANAASCFPEAKSNHIVASLNDQMTKANEVSDHMIRSCLKLAAINEWVSTPSRQRRGFGNGILSDLTYKNSRAACNAHYVKHLNNMFR